MPANKVQISPELVMNALAVPAISDEHAKLIVTSVLAMMKLIEDGRITLEQMLEASDHADRVWASDFATLKQENGK